MWRRLFKVEDSLAVWPLGLCGLPAEGEGSIPGRELRYRQLCGCDHRPLTRHQLQACTVHPHGRLGPTPVSGSGPSLGRRVLSPCSGLAGTAAQGAAAGSGPLNIPSTPQVPLWCPAPRLAPPSSPPSPSVASASPRPAQLPWCASELVPQSKSSQPHPLHAPHRQTGHPLSDPRPSCPRGRLDRPRAPPGSRRGCRAGAGLPPRTPNASTGGEQ